MERLERSLQHSDKAEANKVPIFQKSESRILLGLDRLSEILRYFGNPQKHSESLTVAGTVGKGQIAANTAWELSYHGKIGLYTSPHLESFSERIQVIYHGKATTIPEDTLIGISTEVYNAEKELGIELTYFEHATAIAFLWFREMKVDFSVLEVGLGGRLDAVSLARSKTATISRVHIDHEEFLGSDVEKIAEEKAMCVPKSSTRITLHRRGEPQFRGIENVSEGKIINDFSWELISKKSSEIPLWRRITAHVCERSTGAEFKISFLGPETFFENSVLSSFSVWYILRNFFGVEQNTFTFSVDRIKGRFEVKENIIYDGGHNIVSAMSLYSALPDEGANFVFAFKKGKRWKDFLEHLIPKIKMAFITEFPSSENPYLVAEFLREKGIAVEVVRDHNTLARKIRELARKSPSELVCITGTFYIYDVFKKVFQSTP